MKFKFRNFSYVFFVLGILAYVAIPLNSALNPFNFSKVTSITMSGILMGLNLLFNTIAMVLSSSSLFKPVFFIQLAEFLFVLQSAFNPKTGGFASAGAGVCLSLFSIILTVILRFFLRRLINEEAELDRAAYTDQLTGLLNRRGLNRELALKSTLGREFYLLFLDIDNFKQINDTHGHKVGDYLLTSLTTIWSRKIISERVNFFRLGGDEFAVIADGFSEEEVKKLAETIINSTRTVKLEFDAEITLSIGISRFPQDTDSTEKLLSYADTAMYKVKTNGKDSFSLFDMQMYDELQKKYLTERSLQQALENNSFELFYQPQYNITDKKLIGYEALMRLKEEDGSYASTQELINVAERSGLIIKIDCWVLKNALLQMKPIVLARPELELSVNVSGRHLPRDSFLSEISLFLKETGFPAENLKIEVTESSFIRHMKKAVDIVNGLKNIGVKVALDDFGTGYSSLNYLSEIPVDCLKIDKSFADGIASSTKDRKFIDVIIKLAHMMDCKVVCEGVEKEDQISILKELGCDSVQGFVWGRPLPLEKLTLY